MKRAFDLCFSLFGLLLMSPVLLVCMFLIWLKDFHSPFYIAPRVGRNGRIFRMEARRGSRYTARELFPQADRIVLGLIVSFTKRTALSYDAVNIAEVPA